ncbi:MAG: acetyltransferase, partial [Thermoleophilia bacterium]|nr:acetyltransferase [Thermoleophilia bacterium]
TWGYLVRASLLAPFDGSLPGVFGDNPYPDAINGSLWTLPLEVLAYGMVLVLGVTGLLGRARVLGGLWLVALVVLLAVHGSGLADPASLFAYFLTGSLLYVARSRVRLSWLVAALGVAAWVMTFDTPLLLPVGAITLPYAALVVAYRTTSSLRGVSRLGDVSYGMYVYAFPVQQALVHAWPGMHPATNVLVAAPLTWVAGLASWRLVEQPALRRFGSRRQATPSAVDAVDPAVDAAEVEPAHLG